MTDEEWTEDQRGLLAFLAGVMGGEHHVSGKPKPLGRGFHSGIYISLPDSGFATYDFNLLTRLVIRAHDFKIRVQLKGSSPGRIGLMLHQRHERDGPMYARHPGILEAIQKHSTDPAVSTLLAEVERLREALEPFARQANEVADADDLDHRPVIVANLRRARTAITGSSQ